MQSQQIQSKLQIEFIMLKFHCINNARKRDQDSKYPVWIILDIEKFLRTSKIQVFEDKTNSY